MAGNPIPAKLKFQSLIGRLKISLYYSVIVREALFQSLIGRLKICYKDILDGPN